MRAFLLISGGLAVSAVLWSQGRVVKTPDAARDFLASLTPEQRAKCLKPFTDDYRTNWRFVPASRDGVNLGMLVEGQIARANVLMRASLSESGYRKIETIKGLEDVLFEMENKNAGRDKRLYTFTFFGEPSSKGSWGWRYEGHHVSLNFTYLDGKLVSSTPQFFGANPAEVRTGRQKGTRALAEEEDLGFALLDALTPEQRAQAVIDSKAPAEIVTSNTRKAAIQAKTGLKYSELTRPQQAKLIALVKVHASAQNVEEFSRRWSRVENETLVFAWMGSTARGKGHYYRIQGAKFLIEYDNTQNNANHIHAVWRDFEGDFGQDVLGKHYAENHH